MAHPALRVSVTGAAFLLTAAAGLIACAAPQYTYVADSSANTYYKVPYGWHAVPAASLSSTLRVDRPGAWLSAYGPDAHTASAFNAGSFGVTKPFVFAEVRSLAPDESAAVSYDALADVLFPVTPTARQAAAGQVPYTGFQLLGQAMLTPGQGIHGVRVAFEYTLSNTTDVFEQVALTNADQTELYLLLVHCTAACFSRNQNAINTIVSSFTVRSP